MAIVLLAFSLLACVILISVKKREVGNTGTGENRIDIKTNTKNNLILIDIQII